MAMPYDDRDGYVLGTALHAVTTVNLLTYSSSSFEMNATVYQVRTSGILP